MDELTRIMIKRVQRAPVGRSHSWNTILFLDLTLVDRDLAQLSGFLVPLQGMSMHGADINLSAEISREVSKMGPLFYDRTTRACLVPPIIFCNGFVGARITGDGGHYGQVVVVDDLLHHLDRSEVAQHIPGLP